MGVLQDCFCCKTFNSEPEIKTLNNRDELLSRSVIKEIKRGRNK